MADPTGYTASYSFGGYQANNPTTPLPGPAVDNEFANVAAAVASIIAAVKDVRRSDGRLANGVVTFDSFESGLQLTVDPTNGTLVAAAVATAQAAQAAASASATSASGSATAAGNSAAAAAVSAATVNLSLYLSKADNLASIGSPNTARANLLAAKVDSSDITGRLAALTGRTVTDWNTAVTNGWFCGVAAANGPDASSTWVAQVFAIDALAVTQIAYQLSLAAAGTSAVGIYRRHSYSNAGVIAWQPWESATTIPIGSTVWVNSTVAPTGFVKENGALLSRATYPALWAFANASGNIVTEASWAGGNTGAFSTGDLVTTFRLPDARGEFVRGYDDARGIDSGRVLGAHQADSLKDHTHTTATGATITVVSAAGASVLQPGSTVTGSPSTGAAAETRPRNNAKLACIKY